MSVAASFYPLQFLAEKVGGGLVQVHNLTPPGAEAHDLELSARDAAMLADNDLLLYQGGGLQPAVEKLAHTTASDIAFDISESAKLTLPPPQPLNPGGEPGAPPAPQPAPEQHPEDDHDHQEKPPAQPPQEQAPDDHDHGDQHAAPHPDRAVPPVVPGDDFAVAQASFRPAADHAGPDDHGDDHGHDHGGLTVDPHFWLDPIRMADVGDAIAQKMGQLDPENAQTYLRNADVLRFEMADLDSEFKTKLTSCAQPTFISSHASFGYMADKYGLNMVSISGLNPSIEPKPKSLAKLSDYARNHKIPVVYYEQLVSDAVAKTLAQEAGTETAVLDPLEGLSEESAGGTYTTVMRANLAELLKWQGCQ